MSVRGTVLLLAVVAALGGYLWLAELRPRAGGGRAADVPPPLLAARPAEIGRIDLQEPAGRLTAIRRNGDWVDAEGRAWRREVVVDVVETLATLAPIMVVDPDPENPGDYGFGPDTPRLGVSGADGRTLLDLELGERNPAWTGVYARLAGHREIVLVGALLHWELEKLRDAIPGS